MREKFEAVFVWPLKLMYYEAVYSIVTGLDARRVKLEAFRRSLGYK